METINKTSPKINNLGLFKKISHFKDIFEILEEFLADGKSFFNLISVNRTFRNLTHLKYDKITKIINYLNNHENKYLLFSPYSWLHNPDYFEANKKKFLDHMKDFDMDDKDFIFVFNLSRRLIHKLDFDNFGLNIKGTNILFNYFKNFINVEILILSHCKIDYVAFEEYISKFLKKCCNLKTLTLDNNKLTKYSCLLLNDSLTFNKHLKNLNLTANPLEGGIQCLTVLFNNSVLEELNLNLTKMTCSELNYMSVILNPKASVSNLKHLDLSNNNITEKEESFSVFIETISLNKNLESLYLTNCNFKDNMCVLICKMLKCNNKLKILYLNNNEILINGFNEIIKGLKENNSLEILNVSNRYVNTSGSPREDKEILKSYFENLKQINLFYLIIHANSDCYENNKDFVKKHIKSVKRKWKINLGFGEVDDESIHNFISN